jgi:adenosylmethionine---8-amino-7-oxononanoate aminotransferase
MRVAAEARRLGLLIRPLGNVIVLMPPLSTTMKELRRMVGIVATAIGLVVPPGPGRKEAGKRP